MRLEEIGTSGDMMGIFPAITGSKEKKLPCYVTIWRCENKDEPTVHLKKGSLKNKYLSDEQLLGAEFFLG